jgi:hypothetical protein
MATYSDFRANRVEKQDSGSHDDSINVTTTRMPSDRMSPGVSGGIAGIFAGAGAMGVVHLIDAAALMRPIQAVASARSVDPMIALVVAYTTAAAIGALTGALFAIVTRYLRKGFALLVWAVVFFVSLMMLVLAIASSYGHSPGHLAGPILLASAVYGVIVSMALPLRRRRARRVSAF